VNVGDTLKPFRIASVSPEGMKAWAKFLHDPNPIHLDPAVVKAKGLGDRVINQGPANLAYLINMLQDAVPNGLIESLEVRYVDNVFGGEAVEAGGTVMDVSEETAVSHPCLRMGGIALQKIFVGFLDRIKALFDPGFQCHVWGSSFFSLFPLLLDPFIGLLLRYIVRFQELLIFPFHGIIFVWHCDRDAGFAFDKIAQNG